MADHSAEDQTEAPTAKRLEQAREQGRLPVSRDVAVLATLVGAVVGALALMPPAMRQLSTRLADLIGAVGHTQVTGLLADGTLQAVLLSALMVIASVGAPAAGCAIVSVLLQSGFYVGGTPIHFDPARINPLAGFKRLASMHNLVDFLKACGRLGILVAVVWTAIADKPLAAIESVDWDIGAILPFARLQVEGLARPLLVALAALAGLDIVLVRMRHAKQLRMTREEVRLEQREADGDPFIKAKIRRLREQRSKRRMMQKVKAADVIITNPTHYAIALSYDRQTNAAPRIVAKGVDHMAARIRDEAAKHRIPIMPNPPLARALYQIDLDHEIPAEHYQAVAEIIAFVWKLRNRVATPVS